MKTMNVKRALKKAVRSPIFWLTIVFSAAEIWVYKDQSVTPCFLMILGALFFQWLIADKSKLVCYAAALLGLVIFAAMLRDTSVHDVAAVYLLCLSLTVIAIVAWRTYREAKTSRAARQKRTADFEAMIRELSDAGLDNKYLFSDFECSERITREEIERRTASAKLNRILVEIEKYLGLWPIALQVEYVNPITGGNAAFAAGRFESRYGKRTIRMKIHPNDTHEQLLAVLCHECTHYFMEMHKLNHTGVKDNERLTDTMAILLGFGSALQNGYEPVSKVFESYDRLGRKRTTTTTRRLGYLSCAECELVIRERERWRNNRAKINAESEKDEQNKAKADAERAEYEKLRQRITALQNAAAKSIGTARSTLKEIDAMNLHALSENAAGNPGFLYAMSDYENSDIEDVLRQLEEISSSSEEENRLKWAIGVADEMKKKADMWLAVFRSV